MTGTTGVVRSAGSFRLDEMLARADRLWNYADDVYSATKYPFVSFKVLQTAPTLSAIFDHIADAVTAEMEAKHAPRLRRLERKIARLQAERARLEGEIIAAGGTLPPSVLCLEQQVERPAPDQEEPQRMNKAELDPTEIPWLRDWVDSMDAHAAIDSLFYAVLDHSIPDPPSYWPQVIRRPVTRFTRFRLVCDADLVMRQEIPPPRGESVEAYISRFTRRLLRLDGDLWSFVAVAIAEGRWQKAENPIAYVSRVAQREHRRAEGWLDPSRSNDVYAHEIPNSLDLPPTVTGDPLGALIAERSNSFADAEFMLDFDLAVRRSALSPGALLALLARQEGISRRLAPEVFGLPASEIEAGWKALQRTLPRLRENLSA